MPPSAYYNEIDPYCVQWLRKLIARNLIMDGEVDSRPIQDVKPYELAPFTRCHFFAGIAGWDLALQQANFPIDKPVWTGSCPCQSFSAAGQSRGFADERHLWPFWFHLIDVCRPPVVLGEQVGSKSGGCCSRKKRRYGSRKKSQQEAPRRDCQQGRQKQMG